jgi:3-hydroxyacyl-[acyl-carrier-protein] dehydratase
MNAFTAQDEAQLCEALKRCTPLTRDAACAFRRTGDFEHVPAIVRGVIERFIDRDRRTTLHAAGPKLRLVEDLGIDSLTMMEIVMLAEEVLPLSISNEELRHLRTVGEVEEFIASKLRGLPAPQGSGSATWYLDDLAQAAEKANPPTPFTPDRPAA